MLHDWWCKNKNAYFIAIKITCTFLQVFAMLQYYFSILFQNICLNGDKNYVEIWYNNY